MTSLSYHSSNLSLIALETMGLLVLILINQKKILENLKNCSKKIQIFHRKLVNSRTTYSAQKSCRLFQKIKDRWPPRFHFHSIYDHRIGFFYVTQQKDYLLPLSILREFS